MSKLRCHLWRRVDHSVIDEKYRDKLVIVGRLFDGAPICSWCYLHLREFVEPILTDHDHMVHHQRRDMFPEYARILDKLTAEAIFELKNCRVFEVHPQTPDPREVEQVVEGESRWIRDGGV